MSFNRPFRHSSEWSGRRDSLTRNDSFLGSTDSHSFHERQRIRKLESQDDEDSAPSDGSHTFVDRNGVNKTININDERSIDLSNEEERNLANRIIARVLSVREEHRRRCRENPDTITFDCKNEQFISKNRDHVTIFFLSCVNVPTEVFEEMLAENEQLKQQQKATINYPAITSVVYYHSKLIKHDDQDKPQTWQRVLSVTFLSPKQGSNFSGKYLDEAVSKKAFSEHNKQAERNDPVTVFDSLPVETRAKIDQMITLFYHNKDPSSKTIERIETIHKKLYSIIFRNIEDPEIKISSTVNTMLIFEIQSKRNSEFGFDLFQSLIRLNKHYSGEVKIEFYIKPKKTSVYVREDNQLVKKSIESSVISIAVVKMNSPPNRASNISRFSSSISNTESFVEQERPSRKKRTGDSDIYLGGGGDPRAENSKKSRLDEREDE